MDVFYSGVHAIRWWAWGSIDCADNTGPIGHVTLTRVKERECVSSVDDMVKVGKAVSATMTLDVKLHERDSEWGAAAVAMALTEVVVVGWHETKHRQQGPQVPKTDGYNLEFKQFRCFSIGLDCMHNIHNGCGISLTFNM
jgi:hypothetical protein